MSVHTMRPSPALCANSMTDVKTSEVIPGALKRLLLRRDVDRSRGRYFSFSSAVYKYADDIVAM